MGGPAPNSYPCQRCAGTSLAAATAGNRAAPLRRSLRFMVPAIPETKEQYRKKTKQSNAYVVEDGNYLGGRTGSNNFIQSLKTIRSSKQLVDDCLDVNLCSVEKLDILALGIPQQKWQFRSRQDQSLRAFFDFQATRNPEQLCACL